MTFLIIFHSVDCTLFFAVGYPEVFLRYCNIH